MNIEEARNKKDTLEKTIETLINNFVSETRLTITDITLDTIIRPGSVGTVLLSLEGSL